MSQLAADTREMLSEQVEYRDLLFEMTKRDLLLRYKQTVMGFGWAVFTPLVNTVIFSIIFTRVAPIETPVAYPVFAYCGLLAWNFSASTFRTAVNSLTGNMGLVTKVYFPREIFPFSGLIVALVDLAVGSTVLIVLMIWYGVPPSGYIVLLLFVLLTQVVLTAAVSLVLAMANLFYRDVKYLFEVVLTVWMFATSVLYPSEMMSGTVGALVRWNPMTPIIDGYRAVIFGKTELNLLALAVTLTVSAVALFFAWLSFHRSESDFAERI